VRLDPVAAERDHAVAEDQGQVEVAPPLDLRVEAGDELLERLVRSGTLGRTDPD